MRKIRLDDWMRQAPPPGPGGMCGPRRGGRPAPDWKLADSISYIRMRDEYLQREGILVRIGERKWRLNDSRRG